MNPESDTLELAVRSIEENRKGDATVRVTNAAGTPVRGADVLAEQVRQDFLFGCNIYMFDEFDNERDNELYKQRFCELLNYATTAFYWKHYEPERGKPNYALTDRIVAWCAQNGIRVKGHPLLWDHGASMPAWADGLPPKDVQRQRVVDIVSRYSGKIEFWEVVNEPAHCPKLQIDEPYRWARETDPNAYLIVNDYYALADGCPQFFRLLQEAQRRGVPFDGIGIQAHSPPTMRFPLDRVWRILDEYAGLGRELHITEFTPTSGGQPITGSHLTGSWDESAQADYAAKFYTVCFGHPSVVAITWWDLCEAGAWLEGGGLLRRDLTPKPAYLALKNLIRETWMTKTEGKTDGDGRFSFRGFHGEYTLKVKRDGAVTEQPFHLARDGRSTVDMVLA